VYIQQYGRHLFTLLLLTGSIALSTWVGNKYSLPFVSAGAKTYPCPTPPSNVGTMVHSCPITHPHIETMARACPTISPHVGEAARSCLSTPSHVRTKACPCPLDTEAGAHLLIPAIDLDAPIEPVGILANGALDVPQKNQWTGVGWYDAGPIPGQSGSAIIDGHLDRPGGAPAVFWNLHQLQRGDTVMVVDARGQILHFQVVELQAYQPDEAPLERIYGDHSGRYLNLITCAGFWMPARHQTTERLVVYTKKV